MEQHHSDPAAPARARPLTVFGRQGSPTVTLALPFSRVDVRADDVAPQLGELAALVARLARAVASTTPSDAGERELIDIAMAAETIAVQSNRAAAPASH